MKAKLPATFIRQFTFFRVLAVFFLAILCGLITLVILFYRNNREFNNTASLVTHTRDVIDETNVISSLSKDLQWEARNYILTGDTKSLHSYYTILDSLHKGTTNLTNLVSDNNLQKPFALILQHQIDSLIGFTKKSVELKNKQSFSLNEFLVDVNRHIRFREDIENKIQSIRVEENRLLVLRRAAAFKSINDTHKIFIAFFILISLLLSGASLIVFYHTRKRVKAEKKLAESENRFRILLNSIKDLAIFMIDANGNILNWNEGASNIKGYKDGEVIGKPISIFYTRDAIANNEPMHNLETAARSGSFETEGWRVRKDGSTFWADILITAIFNEEGTIQGFIKVTRDFTLHKKAEEEINRLLQKEKELNQMKSNFVSMASHEFRTPLSTILSSVSLLEHYKTAETQGKRDKHIRRIKSAVSEMVSILEEFLSLEKIEEGKVQVKKEMFNLKELAQQAGAKFNTALKPGQVIEYTHTGKEEVCLDAGFINHILNNLLSNAVKYSPEGTEIIFETCVKKTATILKVKDHGIGISPEDQKHLFERFFRASNTGNIKGTGLGLHIVKRYIDLMQGTIVLESEVSKGTQFTVTIPVSD